MCCLLDASFLLASYVDDHYMLALLEGQLCTVCCMLHFVVTEHFC